MPVVRYKHNRHEVNCFCKYLLFVANFILWSLAILVLAVGIWSWSEKDRFSNFGKLAHVILDPAFVFVVIGTVAFTIGFTGCVGALRENTILLKWYIIFLAGLLISETISGILLITFKDGIKSKAADGFQTFIVRYREDPDQQNFIDWVQEEWLQCCGIEGPKDWDKNNYFNCSSLDIGSREACGVPFSCCKKKADEIVKNKQCGYDVRKNNYSLDLSKIINERGCLHALEDWIEQNLLTITSGMITSFFFKVVGIGFAHHLRTDIIAQKASWY